MPQDQTQQSHLIDIDLGANGGRLVATELKEIEEWLDVEMLFWEPLLNSSEARSGDSAYGLNHTQNVFNDLRQYISQFAGNPGSYLEQIKTALQEHYGKRRVLHSSTSDAQFVIKQFKTVGQVEAAAALTVAVGHNVNMSVPSQCRGAFRFFLHEIGIDPDSANASKAALQQVAHKFSQRYSEDVDASNELRRDLENLVANHTDAASRAPRVVSKFVRRARNLAKAQLQQSYDRLSAFEDIYRTQLGLRAPVEYWRKKRFKHLGLTLGFLVSFLGYLGFLVYLGYLAFPDSGLFSIDTWKDAQLGFVAFAVVIIGILLSLARVLLKLTMSQLHLFNDADERVTMVETYLALLEGGHANESHMNIVLERMFAPAADGIVKEDLGPANSIEALRSLAGRN